MKPLTTLLIEDEYPAMERLERLLAPYADLIQIIGKAYDGLAAVDEIEAKKPDLVFLDIQMPELDGLQVLKKIRRGPMIVFTTAYDEYALEAFENDTVDYLLKPIDPIRLEKTIEKITRFRQTSLDILQNRVRDLISEHGAPQRIQVKQGKVIRFLETSEICFFKATDKYVAVHTETESFLIDESLNLLERRLAANDFVRIHRSALVNWRFLGEVVRETGGAYRVRMKDQKGTRLAVSRSGRVKLGLT